MHELTTARLSLRRWRAPDRGPFAAMNADPEVMRWFPATLTRSQSDELADRIAADMARQGWGLWALEERSTGDFIGFTGLVRVTDDLPFAPAVEVGWRLARDAWGRGLATEAARAATAFAFGELALGEVVSYAVAGNARSRAVMMRLGMRRDLEGDFDHPRVREARLRRHVLYRLSAADREPRSP